MNKYYTCSFCLHMSPCLCAIIKIVKVIMINKIKTMESNQENEKALNHIQKMEVIS